MKRRESYLAFGVPSFSEEEIAAVTRVMRSGWVGQGAETVAFEEELAAFVGAERVVAVNSCTSALFLSLRVLGVGPGDEVIVPSLTWCSTANAALYLGATPVLCDVDLRTMSASPATIVAALTKRTKAVIHVHYGGLASDMEELRAVLPKSVAIVEDAAHALGASYPNGMPVGSSGNLTCFSFYANKNLSTGDGGAVAVNDSALADRVRQASQQGLNSDAWKRYKEPLSALTPAIAELGFKMNFTDLLACIGRIQLRRQPEFQVTRKLIARRYVERITGYTDQIGIQSGVTSDEHTRHLFVVNLPVGDLTLSRDEILLQMRKFNVGASIHYAPLHKLPFYATFQRKALPGIDALAKGIMTLPIGACMNEDDADYVVDVLFEAMEGELDQDAR